MGPIGCLTRGAPQKRPIPVFLRGGVGIALRPAAQAASRGAGQKQSTDPPVHLLNPRPTHPPSDFFFPWLFFFSTFLGVSWQGEFKNTIKMFLQKVHFDKNFDVSVSFSSTFFVLSRFRVFLSDGSSKTLQKSLHTKNRVEKFLQKIRPKIQNRFFLEFFLSHFGAFLDEGSSKTRF
jgi:hypothetical protein